MEEMDPVVRQEINGEVKPEPSHWYEGHISLEDAKTFIKANITTAARSFIAIGFYLKCVRDRELFKEEEYETVWDFAKAEYGISKSTASRYMSMNDRFSENGNSPNIREEYRAFGKSQLQEMLYLEDDQLDQVKPGDRVEDIRNLRKPREVPYIELPGQLDFEIDFPAILPPDYSEAPVTSQKQTFEMNVEELLPDEEQEGIAISQQEPEENQDSETENSQDRAAYVKEQYRLQESFLYPFAVWLIKNHRQWFEEDHMNRVLCVDKSEPQLKSYLGAYPDGSSSYGFPVAGETHYAKLYDNRIVISHFTDGGTVVVDGTAKWFYLAASVQVQWNVVALEEAQEEEKEDQVIDHFLDRNKSIDDAYGWFRSEMVHEYLNTGYKGPNEECEITVLGNVHRVLKGKDVTVFYDISGTAVFDVENERLEREYNYFFGDRNLTESESKEPETVIEVPENVPEQDESVQESAKTVVDGEYVEIPPEPEPVELKQPELPILKNNDQRAAFIDGYETWPLWIETKETGERYYRYDLSDGTSMVVKVYHAMLFDYKAIGKKYEDQYSEGYGKHEYYFLQEGKFFRDCETNRSYLVEKLKEIQKKK